MSADVSMEDVEGEKDDELVIDEGGIRIGDIYIPPPPPPACTFDNNGPRLIITHITNENFKSYAGKHALGPFHKSFTSIVGPNGSGKSNVIDSMLFVFGYRAQKIRSKKIGVLIHNSEQHKNVNSCTVSVHFQKIIDHPGDDYDPVPDSQFVIARTAFRDNSSYYCINDRRCQFKEVAKMLRTHGIDLDHNRFLILQGEVEQISMMKPKGQTEHDTGMLEYLEDIIGCSRFKEPIDLLSKKVDELNEIRTEKLNRVKIVEKEKDELEGLKNEAVDYLKQENEVVKKKNSVYQYYLHEETQKENEATQKKKDIEAGAQGVLNALKEIEDKRKGKEVEMNKLRKKYEKHQKLVEELQAKFSELEKQDVHCREDIKHTTTKSKKLKNSLAQEQKQLSELENLPAKNEEDIEYMLARRAMLEKDQKREEEALTTVMASLKSETQELQAEKDVHETKLMDLKKVVDETKSKMDLAQSELDLYLSNIQKEKQKLEEMKKKHVLVGQNLEEIKRGTAELEKKIPEMSKDLEAKSKELQGILGQEPHLAEALRSKRVKMQEARSAMQASSSRSKVLSFLMEQKANGNIPGVLGRLGDLGAIEDKYDIAISTACGPLDNIVVDTIDTAQICVNYLKHHSVGFATFIGLDKMERWRTYANSKIQTPENVPRLFDLVQVKDQRILTAFYYALRDTLVAKDLEQATRIALHGSSRHRVVSLQGHLIEVSGTMSGGGRPSKGRMGTNIIATEFSPQQMEELTAEVEDMSRRQTEIRRQKSELEEMVASHSRDLEQMKFRQERYKLEITANIEQEKSLTGQLKDQEARVKAATPDKARVKELDAKLAATKEDYNKSAAAAGEVEKEVQRIHSEIMKITGGKMKAAQKKLDDIKKKIDEIDTSVTKANVATKTAERNLKKIATKIKNMEAELEENADKLVKFNELLKELEVKAKDVADNVTKAVEEKMSIESTLSEMKGEVQTLQTEEAKFKSQKLEVDHELEDCTKKIRESHSKINHWKKELSKLSLQEIDGEPDEALQNIIDEELENIDVQAVTYEMNMLQEKLGKLKPNMASVAEYKKKEKLYLERVGELEAVTEQRDARRKAFDDLRKQRLNDFMTGFTIITSKLKEMYQMITLGGDAELELVDSLDPFSEGIEFSVRPPKKSWKKISNLSGGEKTLSSLALVFALHYYKPTPLYVMDEIDAALDFKNVSIVGNYIKERTKNAQFIIISLRNNMFELADRLVGIYKTYNCTKSVTINPKTIAQEMLQGGEGDNTHQP